MNTTLTTVRATEVQIGNIIHAYGARFEVVRIVRFTEQDVVQANIARWLDGRIEVGYFGPSKDFNFQGTSCGMFRIEA